MQTIEQQLKHLDHLQGIINRLAGNSFKLKGWAITLGSALLGLALKGDSSTAEIALLAILPTIVFWLLDGYYLSQERGFRTMYNSAGAAPTANGEIKANKSSLAAVLKAAITPVTAAIYGAMFLAELLVGLGVFAKLVHH